MVEHYEHYHLPLFLVECSLALPQVWWEVKYNGFYNQFPIGFSVPALVELVRQYWRGPPRDHVLSLTDGKEPSWARFYTFPQPFALQPDYHQPEGYYYTFALPLLPPHLTAAIDDPQNTCRQVNWA